MDTEWFEVGEVTDVVDDRGVAIGRLAPGKRYKALDVGPSEIVVGAGDVRGSVPRSAASFVAAPSAIPAGVTQQDTDAVTNSALPSWLFPGLIGVGVGVVAMLLFNVVTSDSDGESDAGLVPEAALVPTSVDQPVTTPAATTIAPATTLAPTTLPPTTIAPTTLAPTTVPPTTVPPTTVPPTTVAPVATTVAPAPTTPPVDAPISFVEARVPGPHIAPAADSALWYAPASGDTNSSVNVCPSGTISLFFDSVDRNGAPVSGSGYGRIDAAGFGTLSMWYLDETGSLVGITEPGEVFQVAVTADAMAIRGDRFDLDLLYTWTWSPSQAVTTCTAIDDLAAQLNL